MSAQQRRPARREPAGSAGTSVGGNRRETPVANGRTAREIASHAAGDPVVVKLGGKALEAPGALREFAAGLTRLSRVTLLVHGGGAEVSAWSTKLGLAPRFDGGLRVTDEPTLEVATAVLAGLANKRLVAALRALGVDAVGLAALDGGSVLAEPHPLAGRLGAVGTIAAVDPSLLATLLAQGRTPVLASIGATAGGELLNLNADDVAAALAVAVGASDLVLLSDTPGLRLAGEVVPTLALSAVEATLARPDVGGGMTPKLRAAAHAVAHGVARAHVAAWRGPDTLAAVLGPERTGTTLVADDRLVTPEAFHA